MGGGGGGGSGGGVEKKFALLEVAPGRLVEVGMCLERQVRRGSIQASGPADLQQREGNVVPAPRFGVLSGISSTAIMEQPTAKQCFVSGAGGFIL